MCTVVNKYRIDPLPTDVYIGRGSKWGNPYIIGKDGTREEVVEKYKEYLWRQIQSGEITARDLRTLDNKRLVCYCSPKLCHGNVLMGAVEWIKSEIQGD